MAAASTEEFENIRKEAYGICQEFLDETWRDLPLSEFRFSSVSGGFSNSLYLCALPEKFVVKNPKTPRQVLLRIYGFLQEDLNVVVTEAACFLLLSEKKLGPKLYGLFPKGRLEEFIPSRNLLSKDFKVMYPAIAKEMAKIHALDLPIRKIPDFWIVLYEKFLNDLETDLKQKENSSFEFLNLYTESKEWLQEEMKKSNSPVVYCHNDLHGGNILFHDDSPSEEDPRLTLIDFELGAYNYRGFDIANYFSEWCFQYKSEPPYFEYSSDKFPSKEERTSFIRTYLDQLVKEGVIPPASVENEIKVILHEIDLFSMAAHLLWSLWCWKLAFRSTTDLSGHALARIGAFKAIKKKYSDQINSGDSTGHL